MGGEYEQTLMARVSQRKPFLQSTSASREMVGAGPGSVRATLNLGVKSGGFLKI